MLPDRVSNPGPLTYESDALPTALRGPAGGICKGLQCCNGVRLYALAFSSVHVCHNRK